MGLYDDLVPTEAEQRVLDATKIGMAYQFETESPSINGAAWGPECTVRSDFVAAFATSSQTNWEITPNGITIIGAKIDGRLNLKHQNILFPLSFDNCFFSDPIELLDTQTKRLTFDNCFIEGGEYFSIRGDSLYVDGTLSFRNSYCNGEVRLLGARIDGQLSFIDTSIVCSKKKKGETDTFSLCAPNMVVDKDIMLVRSRFKGGVNVVGTDVNGQFACFECSFQNDAGIDFNGERLNVKGNLLWNGIKMPPHASVVFSYASVELLVDNSESWPQSSNSLSLDGFKYRALAGEPAPTDAKSRLDWLGRMAKDRYYPQPYEHLAKVLKEMGHTVDARKVLIAKQDREQEERQKERRFISYGWHWLLGKTTSYGYEPWRVFKWMFFLWAFGAMFFSNAFHYDYMQPSKERVFLDTCFVPQPDDTCENWIPAGRRWAKDARYIPADYTEFNSLIYSLDTFLPIVDLHQENYWLPGLDKPWSWFNRAYLWLHIVLGWMLTSIGVAGLTGIIKKD